MIYWEDLDLVRLWANLEHVGGGVRPAVVWCAATPAPSAVRAQAHSIVDFRAISTDADTLTQLRDRLMGALHNARMHGENISVALDKMEVVPGSDMYYIANFTFKAYPR